MQNNPSLYHPRRQGIDSALLALEDEERERRLAAMDAFYRQTRPRPVVRVTLQMCAILLASALLVGLVAVWMIEKIANWAGY